MGKDHHKETSEAESSSIGDCSSDYAGSSSSSETVEDTSFSSLSFGFSSSSFSSACDSSASHPENGDRGPLFELSDLMDHLPIKRSLSKFYDGKSQSFTSLSSVRSIEDLAKAERPSQKRLKPIRSYLKDLDAHHNSPGTPNSARSVNTPDPHIFSSRFSKTTNAKKRRPSSMGIQN